MDERDDLAVRAEVLSKLADQLGEQLAVERKANDELRTILRDGVGGGGGPREAPACVAPVATTLAAVAVGMSLCAAVAASWIGGSTSSTCHARQVAVSAAGASAVPSAIPATLSAPTPSAWPAGSVSPWVYPAGSVGDGVFLAPARQQVQQAQGPDGPGPNPRDCGRVVNATAARCFVDATGGNASGEYMLRNLILAYTLLGERARGRMLAARYFTDYDGSPFAQQIRQLGYNP